MNVYERLGVRAVINATCHWTVYGGSVEWPEVLEAMEEASKSCVDMRQLLDKASEIATTTRPRIVLVRWLWKRPFSATGIPPRSRTGTVKDRRSRPGRKLAPCSKAGARLLPGSAD